MLRFRWILPIIALVSIFCGLARTGAAGQSQWSILINVPEYRLYVLKDGRIYRDFPIAVGKPGTPTPLGEFRLRVKVKNPTWWPLNGGPPVPPGAKNPLGPWWLEVTKSIGIHGGGRPDTVGHAVSHGCIRMMDAHVSQVAPLVQKGTPISIVYHLIRPISIQGGWQAQIYPNLYKRPFPTDHEIEGIFRQYGFSGITDWGLFASLAGTRKSGRINVPAKSPLVVGTLDFEAFRTAEQTWIPLDVVWGLIWLNGLGDMAYWQRLNLELLESSIGGQERRFVPLDVLQKLFVDDPKILVKNDASGVIVAWLNPLNPVPESDPETDSATDSGGTEPEVSAANESPADTGTP